MLKNLFTKLSVKRDTVIAVMTAVIGLAVATAAIATNVGGVTPAPVKSPASSVSPAISAAFAVFREAVTPGSGSAASANDTSSQASGLAESLGHAGANTDLSRHIGPANSEMYATVGQERVCLYGPGESTCAEPSVALAGHLLSYDVCEASLPANHIRITGLVLDGVGSVTVKDSSGAEQVVPVVENGFTTLATGHVTAVEWVKEGTTHSVPITYPESAEASCINQHS